MQNKHKILLGSALLAGGALALLQPRPSIPKNAKPIKNFNLERYLGTWYEIARFDYYFEKDIDNAKNMSRDGCPNLILQNM